MSKTLLNRLAMLEVLDATGPLTISELALRSGLDVTVVSRTVTACEPDGWVLRADGKIAIGPRATLLGHAGPFAELIARAAPLVHAVAGATGLDTHAYSLVGANAVVIASAPGRDATIPAGLVSQAPLHATAAGHVIAGQLDEARLDRLLPPEPFPDAEAVIAGLTGTVAERLSAAPPRGADAPRAFAHDRTGFLSLLRETRDDGYAVDPGALDPTIACFAVPWPQPRFPSALGCLGSPETVFADTALVRDVLTLAAQPGATPRQIISGAAATFTTGQADAPSAPRERR